jgi:hypothetical protein
VFEYIGHIRIIRALELEEQCKEISRIAFGQNFGEEVQKNISQMQKEIAELFEYEPEIETKEEDLDWNKLR